MEDLVSFTACEDLKMATMRPTPAEVPPLIEKQALSAQKDSSLVQGPTRPTQEPSSSVYASASTFDKQEIHVSLQDKIVMRAP